jgi:hypothetical protein
MSGYPVKRKFVYVLVVNHHIGIGRKKLIKRKCYRCKKVKDLSEFRKDKSRKYGYSYICNLCFKERSKIYYLKNKETILNRHRIYRLNNLEKCRESSRTANKKSRENNPQKYKEINKKWYEKHGKEHMRNWRKNNPEKSILINRKHDEKYKLNRRFRTLIYQSLKGNKNGNHWEDLVGYTLKELIQHLENQFREGMTWDNYGKYGWHIDHRRPISSFNITSYNDPEFKECWALKNLQPLWAKENLSKGNRAYG